MRTIRMGEIVKFVDSLGKEHDALVTAIWADPNSNRVVRDGSNAIVECEFNDEKDSPGHKPGLNIVVVLDDEARRDSYGRQIERYTSVVHRAYQIAHGMYWY